MACTVLLPLEPTVEDGVMLPGSNKSVKTRIPTLDASSVWPCSTPNACQDIALLAAIFVSLLRLIVELTILETESSIHAKRKLSLVSPLLFIATRRKSKMEPCVILAVMLGIAETDLFVGRILRLGGSNVEPGLPKMI